MRTFDLQSRAMETRRGPVVFWGRFDAHEPQRPLGLVIRGAFAERDVYDGLPASIPRADVVMAHLPGMHTPFLDESSIPAFAAAFDEAMDVFGRRPHVLGFSMGGLAALAMRTPASILAVDPPLQTAPLWPLREQLQRAARDGESPAIRNWVWNLFGLRADAEENRDYRPLIDAVAAPCTIIVAGEPLEPERASQTIPGLITAEDRVWLSQHPKVRALRAPGIGHNVPGDRDAAIAMADLYRRMIEQHHQPPAAAGQG